MAIVKTGRWKESRQENNEKKRGRGGIEQEKRKKKIEIDLKVKVDNIEQVRKYRQKKKK